MSDTIANLRRQIGSADDLQSVVRTMKALAASSIGQYEQSVRALADYARMVELGLSVCFRTAAPAVTAETGMDSARTAEPPAVCAVVFGSDQGLVGQFNDVVADFAVSALARHSGQARVWAVGERVHGRLADAGLAPAGQFPVPTSVKAIAPLVGKLLVASESREDMDPETELYLYYNSPGSGAVYAPVGKRLLPLDDRWRRELSGRKWPSANLPEILGSGTTALRALIREFLFVSIFRACAESLASENASRLAAMQRADRNIDELLDNLNGSFHRLRQTGIDEELFDVLSGYQALSAGET
ncbi:MAG: F0F1 ATP synthase subunit gamma [Betaproteobacteria bacterium]